MYNVDGASNNVSSVRGGLFRDHNAEFIVGFAENIGHHHSSLIVELSGVMRAIEMSNLHNWTNLWIESYSILVVSAFKSSSIVLWLIRNRWDNCILMTTTVNFMVSHIFREENDSADSVTNVGLSINNILYFWVPPTLALYLFWYI
jgi:hypothetical protein